MAEMRRDVGSSEFKSLAFVTDLGNPLANIFVGPCDCLVSEVWSKTARGHRDRGKDVAFRLSNVL